MDIVAKIVEFLVEPIGRQLGYLIFYNKNVRKLRKQVAVLISIRDKLQSRINTAHRNGEMLVKDVLDWQVQVGKANEQAHAFKRHCWNTSRYSLSRKAKKMTQDVIALQQKGETFITGIIAFPPSPEWTPLPTTTTSESNEISFIVNHVFDTLKDDKMYMIGIHGINRDDRNRLVNNIYRRAKDDNQFEDVAIAVECNEKNIQDEIAYWLGLNFDSTINAARRHRLSRRLEDNRNKLILLDDVCEGLNLEAIGIPCGEGEGNKTCKIIVTSSDKSICEKMNTQKNYKLEVHQQMLLIGGHSTGDLWDDKAHTTIRSIIVAYNTTGICSFQTEYDDNGHWSRSSNHNFTRKSTHDNEKKIELKHPDEFLISASGYYKSEGNHVVLHSLKFESNKQTFGPFGPETGQHFTSAPEAGKIIGFYGRSSHDFLDAFGYYYEPISSPGTAQRTSNFGGPQGFVFDDGRYTTIRKIVIEFASGIRSIQIEYDSNGRSKWSKRHGSSLGTGEFHTIHLDYPGEFVISISGCAAVAEGWFVIVSLNIETNKKVYGPFGEERGKRFKFPPNHIGKFVGFHGNAGGHIDSLGAYIEPFPAQNPTTVFAQVGGDGGSPWDDGAAHTTIRQIILKVSHQGVIVLLHIEYDKNGRSEWTDPHGDPSLFSKVMIEFDYPSEFLMSMSGTTRVLGGWRLVSSLKFESNKRTYGPYGNSTGDPFSTSLSNSGKIVGFHGKSGINLDSVGVYFETFSNS